MRDKRNTELNKFYKQDLKYIDDVLGGRDAGLLIHTVARTLKKILKDKTCLELRTMELTFNDFFSSKWDFKKMDYINEGKQR